MTEYEFFIIWRLSFRLDHIFKIKILTKNGIRPFALSWRIASCSRSPGKLRLPSLSMYRIFTRPIRPAFSIEECAWKSVEGICIGHSHVISASKGF